jgi:hypothetical protein
MEKEVTIVKGSLKGFFGLYINEYPDRDPEGVHAASYRMTDDELLELRDKIDEALTVWGE